LDGQIDTSLQGRDQQALCEVCGFRDDPAEFMYCDVCNKGWHTYCCTPPYAAVPRGAFICPRCQSAGATAADAAARSQQQQQARAQQQHTPELFPNADMRRRDGRAAAIDGRLVQPKGSSAVWGRVRYLGPQARPKYFKIVFSDGRQPQHCSYTQLQNGKMLTLLPGGTALPAGITI
jgi:PHD-finger